MGTGRLIFPLTFGEQDYAETAERFLTAAHAMQADGWWWRDERLTSRTIGLRMLREMIAHRLR